MLVITRTIDEGFNFDGPGSARIIDVRGNRVRIGLDGPQATKFLRDELDDRKTPREPDAR